MRGSEDLLDGGEECRVLVAGRGRVTRLPGEAGEIPPGDEGAKPGPATSPSRRFAPRGLTLVNPDIGRAHKHPAQWVVEVASAQLRVLAAEFGLTPSSEQ